VYMPVGLDIGGRSPHEIALSIISEIQGVRYGKSGLPHLGKVKT
jgi:xanthine/CO dehydrogenase XdhC/CoxF family maturation factor